MSCAVPPRPHPPSLRGREQVYLDLWCVAGRGIWFLLPFSLFGRNDLYSSFLSDTKMYLPQIAVNKFIFTLSLAGNMMGTYTT